MIKRVHFVKILHSVFKKDERIEKPLLTAVLAYDAIAPKLMDPDQTYYVAIHLDVVKQGLGLIMVQNKEGERITISPRESCLCGSILFVPETLATKHRLI